MQQFLVGLQLIDAALENLMLDGQFYLHHAHLHEETLGSIELAITLELRGQTALTKHSLYWISLFFSFIGVVLVAIAGEVIERVLNCVHTS